MTNVQDEMATATPNSPSRWGVWVAYGACRWAFLVFGGFVALELIRPWGLMVPRWVLLILAWGAGILLLVHGGLYFVVGVLAWSGAISVRTPETVLHWYTFL